MIRARVLKFVLVLVGLVFVALVYPLKVFIALDPSMAMMFSVYVTLGVFLLFAVRNPAANRSLIAFTAWSSLVHAIVMAGQAYKGMVPREELLGSIALTVIGVSLVVLAPAKQPRQLVSVAAA